MPKMDLVALFNSKDRFMRYVDQYNERYRSETESKELYLSAIGKYRRARDYADLLQDTSYVTLVHRTLDSWDLNKRGARLTDLHTFERSIHENAKLLISMSRYRMERLNKSEQGVLFNNLWLLFNNLAVMDTRSRIVGVSKALHFLLPDLVMPIDRRYILSLLYLQQTRYSKEVKKEFSDFKDIFSEYVRLAQHINLSEDDVDNIGWNTSVPKIIDNAIIGFVLVEIDDKVKESLSCG